MQGIKSYIDYYSFGALMPGRGTNTNQYRYSFSGKENDQEIKGDGNSIDFGARMYDPRLGRWLSTDPLAAKYASISPYAAFKNSPIALNDPDGRDAKVTIVKNENGGGKIKVSSTIHVIGATQEQVDQYNGWVAGLNKTGCYRDAQGNDWEVEIEMNYQVYDPNVALQAGDNKMLLGVEGTSHGDASVQLTGSKNPEDPESSIVWEYSATTPDVALIEKGKESSEYTVIHETLHLMGLSDRYHKGKTKHTNSSGQTYYMPNPVSDDTYQGDIMDEGTRISQAHFDNYARTLSMLQTTIHILKTMVDINKADGSKVGANSGGLQGAEKEVETSVPSF